MQFETGILAKRHIEKQLLVENKLIFSGPESELSIYDTYRAATHIGLDAPQLMYCGMVKGKKVMHHTEQEYSNNNSQVFLPHESFVIPPGGYVEIDFPEAEEHQPTTCLTIEISKQRIETLADGMRNLTSMEDVQHDWNYLPHIIHTQHTSDTQQLLDRLVALFTQNHPDKEMMIDLNISELIIRLLRQQGREILLNYCRKAPDTSGITAAINSLEQNLILPFDIDELCQQACMSRSNLYASFKKQLGCSPGEFFQQLRLKSSAEALSSGKTVTQACYDSGFNNPSHFSRRFTLFFGCTPSQFRAKYFSV